MTPGPHRTMVTAMNSILTFWNNHAIIKTIVTVFSLENKVTVFQSVKWRYCAVWHFFCFLPAKMRVEINYFNGREGPAERGIT